MRSAASEHLSTPPPEDWRKKAACRDEDPELFFPIGDSTFAAQHQIREALAVCGGCEVRQECLLWAIDNNCAFGVWGGVDEDERRGMVRRKQRQKGAKR